MLFVLKHLVTWEPGKESAVEAPLFHSPLCGVSGCICRGCVAGTPSPHPTISPLLWGCQIQGKPLPLRCTQA